MSADVRSGRRTTALLLLAGLLPALLTVPAAADPGGFDPAFGEGGLVTLQRLSVGDAAQDGAGRIVVVGSAVPYRNDGDIGIVRLLDNGTFDPAFSHDGFARTDLGSTEEATAVAIQADGKIVVAGVKGKWWIPDKGRVVVVRYLPGGHLDRSFAGDGAIAVDVGDDVAVSDVALLGGGQIVVVGYFGYRDGAPTPYAVLLGAGGRVRRVLTETAWPHGAWFFALIPWPGGGFVVAGAREDGPVGVGGMLAVRYRADGSRDPSFSVDGARTFRIADGYAFAIARAPGGRMVLAGQAAGCWAGPCAAVVRLDGSGARDLTFGDRGVVVLDAFTYGYDQAKAVAVDGRSTVVGVRTSTSDTSIAAVARLTFRGKNDRSFGTGGRVEYVLGPDSDSWLRALMVVPGVGYVAAGAGVVSRLLSV